LSKIKNLPNSGFLVNFSVPDGIGRDIFGKFQKKAPDFSGASRFSI
jgi:hypothetical protein